MAERRSLKYFPARVLLSQEPILDDEYYPRRIPEEDEVEGEFTTGTYTGDGAATQSITGLGFQPDAVFVLKQTTSGKNSGIKTDQDGLNASWGRRDASRQGYATTHIVSLDADGFTVGDGSGPGAIANVFNLLGTVYTYHAFQKG